MSDKPFHLSVKVVIRDSAGQCLLLRRSKNSRGNPGKWDLPGGKIDTGESLEQALLREVLEETGLSISLRHVLGTAESESPVARVAYLIVEGRLETGELCLSSEHDGYMWVRPQELANMDLASQFQAFARAYGQTPG